MTKSRNVYILTGPIRTGKTTSIIDWRKWNVSGIAQPVINGKRCLLDLKSGKTVSLEADSGDTNIIKVGKFWFKEGSFDWAKETLQNAAAKKPDWLVIDEFGKLELKGRGLEPVVTKLVKNEKFLNSSKLLIVIRDYLVEDALSKLSLRHDETIIMEDLSEL